MYPVWPQDVRKSSKKETTVIFFLQKKIKVQIDQRNKFRFKYGRKCVCVGGVGGVYIQIYGITM